jgi:hypothetical protein
MWADPNNPNWTKDISFPMGSLVFKMIYTNATNDEVPMLEGAPSWEGLIAAQSADPTKKPDPAVRDKTNPQRVRLIQMDFAVRDDRAVTGWMWGTFMYTNTSGKTGWDGLIPVGLQWGNDHELTQAAYDAGKRVQQSWINPEADAVRISLHGGRPSFGWNGRLNGPADNFASACASCHSTAQRPVKIGMAQPTPVKQPDGSYRPVNDHETMKWFKDVPCGTPFTEGSITADYSLQLAIGYQHYTKWRHGQPKVPGKGRDHAPLPPSQSFPDNPRQGPPIEYEKPRV